MKNGPYLLITVLWISTSCSTSKPTLNTVSAVDYNRYLGKWYEIARFPNRFERGMYCVTATYSLSKNGKKIDVLNAGYVEGRISKYKSSKGKAWVPNPFRPGELKVSFFYPFAGDYYIIHLDQQNYRYALVGSPSRKYLWILSRTPQMDQVLYDQLLQIAENNGFDTSLLVKKWQHCENE